MPNRIDTDAEINSIRVKEASPPATPASGYGQLYAKTDGKLYFKNDAGLEIDLTLTGSAGGGYSYAQYSHIEAQNINGGTATGSVWATRVLNIESADPNGIGTLATGTSQITLGAGSYQARAVASFYRCGTIRLRVWDVTNSTTLVIGRVVNLLTSTDYVITAEASGRFTLADTASIELQYRIGLFTSSPLNLGAPANESGVNEYYAQLELWKE